MVLSILISTIDSGIEKIKDVLLLYRPDVKYIVSHQFTDEKFKIIPVELKRDDVIVSQIPGKGVTKSRNHAISLAAGDICLITDDDVRYTNEFLNTIIQTFQERNPDVALFKIKTNEGEGAYKNYPAEERRLNLKNLHSPSTIEIAFKTEKIKGSIFFDERFGLGSFLNGGAEKFFVRDAIEKGLNVCYFPEYVVNHPEESTIKSLPKYHKRRVMVWGGSDARINGWLAIPKSFLGTIKFIPDLIKNRKNPFVYFYQRIKASIYILTTKPGKVVAKK